MRTSSKDPIKKAWAHWHKAQEILATKAGADDGYYTERKYIRMAGKKAWKGVVIAVHAVLDIRDLPEGESLYIEHYRPLIEPIDKEAFLDLQSAFLGLCRSMVWDNTSGVEIINLYMEVAHKLLTWCEKHYQSKAN